MQVFFTLQIPMHLRANWEGFYLEILMIAGLAAYALNFFGGRSKNSKLATAWWVIVLHVTVSLIIHYYFCNTQPEIF